MTDTKPTMARIAQLQEDDVIRVLSEQHARIRELFSAVAAAQGDDRQRLFDELRTLLAVHETAEEVVLRPATVDAGAKAVADARNLEQKELSEMLRSLEEHDVAGNSFASKFGQLEELVLQHVESEEDTEFPVILSTCDEATRLGLGTALKRAESVAPTHPHPGTAGSTATQLVAAPFVTIVDRVRDALT